MGWATRALLAYRSDDAESAVEYVAKSEDNNPTYFSHAMNLAVLAMAQHELDHPDEAAAALAEASQLITRLRENPNNQGHHDLQIAEIRCSAKPQRRSTSRPMRMRIGDRLNWTRDRTLLDPGLRRDNRRTTPQSCHAPVAWQCLPCTRLTNLSAWCKVAAAGPGSRRWVRTVRNCW